MSQKGRNDDAIVFFGKDHFVVENYGKFSLYDIHNFIIVNDTIGNKIIVACSDDVLRFADIWVQFIKTFQIDQCFHLFSFIITEKRKKIKLKIFSLSGTDKRELRNAKSG